MKTYRCPVCRKQLTKSEYEKALKIHEAREAHLRQKEELLEKKEREFPQKLAEAKKLAKAQEKARAERLTAGLRGQLQKARDRIRQLERGSTPQTEGLEFEDKLVARLRREFPGDDTQPKGKGGDVLQIVKHQGQDAGVIIYECKRTPKIQNAHIRQAYQAKQLRRADFAVLVTTGQKRGFSGVALASSVLIVAPLAVIPIVSLLRDQLIEMLKAKVTKAKRAKIAQNIMKYITSPQFKNAIEEVVQLSVELEDMIREEFNDHMRIWQKRAERYQRIRWDGSQIQDNLQMVLHGKEPKRLGHPKPTPLQLPPANE